MSPSWLDLHPNLGIDDVIRECGVDEGLKLLLGQTGYELYVLLDGAFQRLFDMLLGFFVDLFPFVGEFEIGAGGVSVFDDGSHILEDAFGEGSVRVLLEDEDSFEQIREFDRREEEQRLEVDIASHRFFRGAETEDDERLRRTHVTNYLAVISA